METLILEPNDIEKIGMQISQLSIILDRLRPRDGTYTVDLRKVNLLRPTLILGLTSVINSCNKRGHRFELVNVVDSVQKYLDLINFPHGLMPDFHTDWSHRLDCCAGKTYLPIINFSTAQDQNSTNFRNEVLSKVNKLIAERLGLTLSECGYISYFLSEFTDNIVEHSGAPRGKLFFQYYPKMEFLEICILDEGKTLLGAYQASGRFQVDRSVDAIKLAISGKSSKSEERGFGIPSSHQFILTHLSGKMILVSGDGMLANKVVIPYTSKWEGTILSLIVPKVKMRNWLDLM